MNDEDYFYRYFRNEKEDFNGIYIPIKKGIGYVAVGLKGDDFYPKFINDNMRSIKEKYKYKHFEFINEPPPSGVVCHCINFIFGGFDE